MKHHDERIFTMAQVAKLTDLQLVYHDGRYIWARPTTRPQPQAVDQYDPQAKPVEPAVV